MGEELSEEGGKRGLWGQSGPWEFKVSVRRLMWLESRELRGSSWRGEVRKRGKDPITLGLVGQRKDFAFILNGTGGHWRVLEDST